MATLQRQALLFASVRIPLTIAVLLGLAAVSAAEVTLDGSLGGPKGTVSGPAFLIPDSVGSRAGANLFHSFGKFNIANGESATFTNSGAALSNVIARVTGGSSSIDGLIRSTITGANLFLLNPAGVMFGPNASLDVQGSFHASTADYLRFGNGETFYANPAAASVLSVASPEAFGFLSSAPGSISIDRSVLQVPAGQTLSLIGGNISAQNDPTSPNYFDFQNVAYGPNFYLLNAPGGKINLVSVASPGLVNLNQPDVGSFAKLGTIEFTNGANITVASDIYASGPAGSIVIRGGNILFKDIGIIDWLVNGIEASGSPAGLVDIQGGSLHLDNAFIGLFNTGDAALGKIANIKLSGDFLMTNGSYIDSTNYGWGNAGAMEITADRVRLGDDNPKTSPYASLEFYGCIRSSSAYGGTGRGGDISITARDITVQNGFAIFAASPKDAPGFGDAGNITVHADTLQLKDKGQIVTNAFGSGAGGIVNVVARDILISDTNRTVVANTDQVAGIAANTQDSVGGKILVTADNLRLQDGGQISTVLYGKGTGADVAINAKSMIVSGFVADSSLGAKPYGLSAVDGRVFGVDAKGQGGNITVTTDSLRLENGGVIRTGLYNDAPAPAKAGNITVNAKTIDIASRGQIYADSFRGTGNSGNITVNAATMNITGANNVPRPGPLDFDFTGLSTTTNAGTGGKITVALSGNLTATNGGGIKADTQGTGSGGAIDLTAMNMTLSDMGSINASSSGTGRAGNIDIRTGILRVETGSSITTQAGDQGVGGNVTVTADKADLASSGQISSSTSGVGDAGNIAMTLTGDLSVSGGAALTTETTGSGTGGSINLNVNNLALTDQGEITSSSSGSGNAGKITLAVAGDLTSSGGVISADSKSAGAGEDITITSKNLTLSDKGSINASSRGAGKAGNIAIQTGALKLATGATITTQTSDQGAGGKVTVTADKADLASAGQITSSASGVGDAGSIAMTLTGDLTVSGGAALTTETTGSGLGGSVNVKVNNLTLSNQGKITSSSSGSKKAGDITLNVGGDLTSSGGIVSADAKSSGAGGAIDIASKNLTLTDKGTISASSSGTGNAGNIDIRTGALSVKTGSTITTQAGDQGTGGKVTITADEANLASSGQISSSASGAGKAGSIAMTLTGDLSVSGGAAISADTKGGGAGGSVNLKVNNLALSDQGKISSSSSGSGSAGNITLSVAGDLISSGGTVSADAKSSGAGGAIELTAKNVTLSDKGSISASSSGTGDAGSIGIQTGVLSDKTGSTISTQTGDQGAGGTVTITADKADLASAGQISSSASGAGKAGSIAMNLTGDLSVSGGAAISADTKGAGEGGSVNLKSANLTITDSGQITSSASGSGNAGTITVALAGDLTATSGASISADTKGAGAGGAVNIEAGNILLSDKASLGAASSGSGNAGNIGIRTGNMRIEKGAAISTRAQDKGAGGTITVNAANLELADSGQISSSSSASGNAGDINITSSDSLRMRNSSITTESIKADGGNIVIKAPNRIHIFESKVTASVGGGKSTTGGNISIDPEYLIVRNSQIVANAFEGTGGNIKIVANTFLSDGMSVVDASSALGISGSVDILAPNNNISGLISPLSSEFTSASALLRERCIARIREGKYSSFVVGGRDGLPIEPGYLLPTLLH